MTEPLKEFDPTAMPIWEELDEITKDIPKEELDRLVPDWHHEFYYVASPRRDGTSPTLEKACGERMFLFRREAEEYADSLRNDLPGVNYRVFTATAVIKRIQ